MAWFELRSPQQITLYPNLITANSVSDPTDVFNSTYIQRGRDWIQNYSRVASGTFDLEYKLRAGTHNISNTVFPAVGPGFYLSTAIYPGSEFRRKTVAKGSDTRGRVAFSLRSLRLSAEVDSDVYTIAAILNNSPQIIKKETYPLRAAIADPYLVPIFINPSQADYSQYTNKYYTVTKNGTGHYTITFRRLSMSAPPYPYMSVQTNGAGQSYFATVSNVSTSGFTLRTANSANALADLNCAGFVLFSGNGKEQYQNNIVKFPHRKGLVLGGYLDLANEMGQGSTLLPLYRNYFSELTHVGTGLFEMTLSPRYSDLLTDVGILAVNGSNLSGSTFPVGKWAQKNKIILNLFTADSTTLTNRGSYFLALNWGDRTNY